MRKVALPSYITGVPSDPIEFGSDSIIIEDDGVEYLVGKAASDRDPEGFRQYHGNFKRPQYRRLVKALIASLLGEGEHTGSLALCASRDAVRGLRKAPGSPKFSDEQWQLMLSSISEIKYRVGSSLAPQKICKIMPTDDGLLYLENQAVKEAIPTQMKSFVLWQLGHGDFQQTTFIDHKAKPDTHARVEGISGATKIFARLTGHAAADAEEGWRVGRLSRPGGMNGQEYTAEELKNLKLKALREYFGTIVPKLLNLNQNYSKRAVNVILSGGGAKDELAVQVLKEEVEAEGAYKLHLISNLPIKDERCDDSSFTTVVGMLQKAQIALDPGNSFLKAGTTL